MGDEVFCRSCLKTRNIGAFDLPIDEKKPKCRRCVEKLGQLTTPRVMPNGATLTVKHLETGRVKRNMRYGQKGHDILMKFIEGGEK